MKVGRTLMQVHKITTHAAAAAADHLTFRSLYGGGPMEVYTMWHCTVLLVAPLDQDLLLDPVIILFPTIDTNTRGHDFGDHMHCL